jgi:hypothetical protein
MLTPREQIFFPIVANGHFWNFFRRHYGENAEIGTGEMVWERDMEGRGDRMQCL